MDARKQVGRNIRRLRVAKNISQEALAVDAEVGRAYVSGLERGTKNPTLLVLDRLAKALGAQINDFFSAKPGDAAPLRPGRRPRS